MKKEGKDRGGEYAACYMREVHQMSDVGAIKEPQSAARGSAQREVLLVPSPA